MGGSPPKDNSDVNIMNFISVVPLFFIMVCLSSFRMYDTFIPNKYTACIVVDTYYLLL